MTTHLHSDPGERKMSAWEPWSPNDKEPWHVRRVVHLHRRAGFAATWKEIERDLRDGPQTAIQRLLDGQAYQTGVPARFSSTADAIGLSAKGCNSSSRLQAWWVYRLIYSPDPLRERLALLWHHHFATSNAKIRSNEVMYQQNQILRQYGLGEFGELFSRVMHDPAVLIYLDANSNRASHPNENLGREIMELFSMGEGNYTEADVRNAARSLTGWTVKRNRMYFEPDFHDQGEKQLLGQRGNFRGEDVVRIVLQHPATARRITWRVCQMLMGEDVVDGTALDELAKRFRQNNLNIFWLVKTILNSRLFFCDENIGTRVVGAVEFVIGSIRATGTLIPSPSTSIVAEWAARMGQRLFYPPSVFGFPEGRRWITSQWLIARNRFIYELLAGKLHRAAFDATKSLKASVGESVDINDPRFLTSLLLVADDEDQLQELHQRPTGDVGDVLSEILTSPLANLA